jgi:DNA helicase-4
MAINNPASYYLESSILLILVLAYFLFIRLKKSKREVPGVKEKLAKLGLCFESLKERFNDDSQYLRFSKLILFKKDLQELKKEVQASRNIFLRSEIQAISLNINVFESNFEKQRDEVNERFFQKEKESAKSIFYDGDGNNLLTEEQIKAVLCDDDRNLIIAGAGSGKTRVIDFKVRYLVNHKKISPDKIILLSFSRKSAGDLAKKISANVPGIEARTIHSFSSQIIGKQGKDLFDEGKKELSLFVLKSLVQTLKEKKFYLIFDKFYQNSFSDIKPLIFYKSLDELRQDLKKHNSKLDRFDDKFEEVRILRTFKTLRGEYVRSIDERYIADFLYLHDINYLYEEKYPHANEKYYPDFYLVDDDVYLEHFAITSNGGPPSWFENPKKYMDGIEWKRKIHSKNQTRMIESFSYLLNGGDTSAYLGELLSKNGITIKTLSEDAYSKISRGFGQFFTRFYTAYKLSGLKIESLKEMFIDPRYSLFLQLYERFLHHYELLVQNENKMDFNDMIISAAHKYQNGHTKSYDYIIVDEFQDTSNLAMSLLNQVYLSSHNSSLMSVGDDWQAIYGFNGSDVTILSEYEKKYSGASVQKLCSNFRSHSRIVELGNRFISKNPSQISKEVVSKNNNFKDSDIGFLSFEQMEKIIKAIPDDESIFVLYRYNEDCPAVQGIFKEFFSLDKTRKPVRKTTCTKNISLLTIHGSKGLEARHVFILFPDGIRKKFPSEIEDHFVFNMLKTHSDDFPFSEERRLMYVAITRAEQNLYFVSTNKSGDPNSVFWDELLEMV